MRKHVIAYLHSHWDREWYREFEIFRLRLLRVFDNVLKLLSKGKIPSFYFDGQVCALEDYLAMRPEKTELVEGLIRHKKLFIGPFYCLTDEFLTDKKLISIKTNVVVEPSNGFIDGRGYSTVKMYNYVVIYKEKEKEINPYEEDNKFMEEYFKNNPHLS